jgi:hypothetical protein
MCSLNGTVPSITASIIKYALMSFKTRQTIPVNVTKNLTKRYVIPSVGSLESLKEVIT